jgi:hypothetical protein
MFGAKVGGLHGGTGHMTYYYDAATAELEHLRFKQQLEHLRFKQRRLRQPNERQEMSPAIKMIIGDWYVDELGMPTREITVRE